MGFGWVGIGRGQGGFAEHKALGKVGGEAIIQGGGCLGMLLGSPAVGSRTGMVVRLESTIGI